MAMSKKDFVALADLIVEHNRIARHPANIGGDMREFDAQHIETLKQFCRRQNSAFMSERWLQYIVGKCGVNGGAVKTSVKGGTQ